ncbi:MAG: undecaprenyl-diphosphatase [bacterium]|jgi:undecaprenyl-diphosphatase
MPPEADVPLVQASLRTREAVALGLLHGPAELLPISSSAHIALVPWLLGWRYPELDAEQRKAFEVALHAGTVAALVVGLRGELAAELRTLDREGLRRLLLSTLPPGLAGLALERTIERRLGTPGATAIGLAVGAVAMAAADTAGPRTRHRQDAGDRDALALGLAQACALVPGISRSGATLTAARARGFAPADASVLSRQAALPVIAGAAGLKGARALRDGLPRGAAPAFAAGIAAAFWGTLASLRVVRAADEGRSLLGFAAYRIALAALVHRRLRACRDR